MNDETFVQYAVEKMKVNASAANDYTKRGNLYQAGMKSGAVLTLISSLNRLGYCADCECDTSSIGTVTFKSIVVNGTQVFNSMRKI